MRKFLIIPALFALVATLALTTGCNTGPSAEEKAEMAMQNQFDAVQKAYSELQGKREELKTAKATITEIEAIRERKRTDEQKAQLEEATKKVTELSKAVDEGYTSLQNILTPLLTTLLNEHRDAPQTLEALKIYSDEAIIAAEEMVQKSGDYKKAMKSLSTAEGYYKAIGQAPYPSLEDKIKEYEDWRFITKERFDKVNKGMTEEEVKALIGVPYYRNIQEDPKKGVTAWLYKKREGGGAGIYFKTERQKVYSKNWTALKTKVSSD